MHSALARIAAHGPVRFDRFQSDALYGPDGFYSTGGSAGRGADFLTAVEVGTEFASCIAVDLDNRWRSMGNPDPFIVVEGGAGVGTLCVNIFELGPECVEALRWVMVERSEAHREAAMARLASDVFGDRDELPVAAVAGLELMQLRESAHFVVSNELLDNMAVRVIRRTNGWEELFVDVRGDDACEVWLALDEEAARRADHHGADVPVGATIPLADHAVQWVARALGAIEQGGAMIAFDYGGSTAELADRPDRGWLRTYSSHGRGISPLERVGLQDITADVAFDQLPGRPRIEKQADWLSRRRPDSGPLSAEFEMLVDLDGMGAFKVATWQRGQTPSS